MLKQTVCRSVMWLVACTLSSHTFADERLQNWHQFRGPLATGVAPAANPPIEWSSTKNIRWKVAIPGSGSASPIVWGDRIFILTAIKTDRTADGAEASHSTIRPTLTPVAYSQEQLLAQRDDNRGGQGDRRSGAGRNGGGRGRGGFGRGGPAGGNRFGIVPPTNYYQFVVLCIDRNSGETVWQRTAAEVVPHEGHHNTSSFASASPVTDGENLYVSFGSRGIYCFDLNGNPRWERDFGQMQTSNSFGEGTSPALHGDTLVINWDHEGQSFITALDARTGNPKWKKSRDEGTTWATPLIVESGDRTQVITSGSNRIRSYDLADGELLWECGGLGSNPIATPIVSDGLAVCMTGHQNPAGIAVPLDAQGDVTRSDTIAWQVDDTPYIASPILTDGLLYFTKGRNAILSCVDPKTGETVFANKRLPDMETLYSSPVGAAGRIYISSREGATVVIKPGREPEILATNTLDDEVIDATPAIVGREIIIRGTGHLYCIAEE